jgi:hypothetical protein
MSKIQRKLNHKRPRTDETDSGDWSPPWNETSDVFILTEPLSEVRPEEDPVRSTNVLKALEELGALEGFIAGAIAHSENGRAMGVLGGAASFDIETAVRANTRVIRAKRETVELLGLGQSIQDILITLDHQYHLMRPVAQNPRLFIYLALSSADANLAIARFKLAEIATTLEL